MDRQGALRARSSRFVKLRRGLVVAVGTLVALELALQISAVWAQRLYRREQAALTDGSIRVLCLGDSNTYGLYVAPHESWPSQVQALLDRRQPGRYQLVNLGFPGTPTSRIADNLPAFLERLQPDMVIVLAGVNDLLYGAIDASERSPSVAARVREFAQANIRTFRAILRWKRASPPPAIKNDMDDLARGLASLPEMSDSEALETLVGLYRDRGFEVRAAGKDYFLRYREKEVHINPALPTFRVHDLFALSNAWFALPMQAGLDHRDWDLHAQMRIDGETFEMKPVRGQPGSDEAIAVRNLGHIASLVRRAGIPFLVMTYASHGFHYGPANVAIRKAALHHRLDILDLEPEIAKECPDVACRALFFPDFHPNAAGYARMAERIAARLQSSMP